MVMLVEMLFVPGSLVFLVGLLMLATWLDTWLVDFDRETELVHVPPADRSSRTKSNRA
jgi:hypothetical protein